MALFQNLSISSTLSTVANSARSMSISYLEARLKDQQMKGKLRFYYKSESESFLRVLVNSALQTLATVAKNELISEAKSLMSSKKTAQLKSTILNSQKTQLIKNGTLQNNQNEENKYGLIKIKDTSGKDRNVYCRDCYGYFCPDGIMLHIPTKNDVSYNISKNTYGEDLSKSNKKSQNNSEKDGFGTYTAKHLVWYDPTALVTINSEKNVVLTKVAGRDYSRKELISNGDISFSVSGHILSTMADLYPEEEVKKFEECMQYKGIVEVNNISLGQFNINKILIKDFSLTPTEGSKAMQTYSFNAVGIQPDSEIEVTEDSLVIDEYIASEEDETESKWATFMKDLATGTASSLLTFADSVGSQSISKIKI